MLIPLANILQPIIDPLESVMVFIHDHVVGGSWGLAIVGLTIVVRIVLLPLTLKQVKSMQELQRLAPEIKKLQARYKDDKQRQQQEMMKLYKEHQVNPFGSCLPLVLQLPVFFGLFYMLRKDLKIDICGHALKAHHIVGNAINSAHCEKVAHGSAKFLFIPDITANATGMGLVVLIFLYIGSQLASSLLNQRMMMIGLPLVFTLFIIRFPAGLIVYWITTNLWTIVQQYVVRRRGGVAALPTAAPAPAGAAAVPSNGGGLGGLGRLLRGGSGADGAPEGDRGRGASASRKSDGAAASTGSTRVTTAPPPRPPRKKKKRSGRRR